MHGELWPTALLKLTNLSINRIMPTHEFNYQGTGYLSVTFGILCLPLVPGTVNCLLCANLYRLSFITLVSVKDLKRL